MGEPGGSSAAPRAEKGRRRHPRFSVPLSQQTADPPKAPSERWRWGRTAGLREAREGNDPPNPPRSCARGACLYLRSSFLPQERKPGAVLLKSGGLGAQLPPQSSLVTLEPPLPSSGPESRPQPPPRHPVLQVTQPVPGAARPGSVSGHRPRPERTEFTALMAQEGTSQQLRAWGCRAGSEAPRTPWGHSARMGCSRVSPVNLL